MHVGALQDIWKEFWRLFMRPEDPGDTTELKADTKNKKKKHWKRVQVKSY